MEKRQGIKAIGDKTQLPPEIIQHIQSFLSAKEGARTAILSKSWCNPWLTRPNLHFSNLDIPTLSALVKFANNTMQRYEELGLNIQSLRLSMNDYESAGSINPLVTELIAKAMKLGTTDVELDFLQTNATICLRLLLESENNLVRLSLRNCKIHHDIEDKTCWRRLKYLKLERVDFEANIVSMCPVIEELFLSECKIRCSRVTSKSLECISVIHMSTTSVLTASFDVSKIRKFKFTGSSIPELSFTVPREREWESGINIMINSCLYKKSWSVELSQFLRTLSHSKISLNLSTGISCRVIDIPDAFEWVNRKAPIGVEKLTYAPHSPHDHALLLDELFRCCRPSLLNLCGLPWRCKAKKNMREVLCMTVIGGGGGERGCMCDLEEVNLEYGPIEGGESSSSSIKTKVGLRLRWS